MPALDYKEYYYDKDYNSSKNNKINNRVKNHYQEIRKTSNKTKMQVSNLMNDDFKSHNNKEDFSSNAEILQSILETFPSAFYTNEADEDFKRALNNFKKNEKKNSKRIIKNKKVIKPEEIELEDVENVDNVRNTKNNKSRLKVFNVFLAICIFAMMFLICYRESQINEKFNKVEKAKNELANKKIVNEQLEADIDVQTDLNYIENYAKYQIGMQKPTDNQIVYINVEKKDKIITPVKIDEEENNKVWYEEIFENLEKLFN